VTDVPAPIRIEVLARTDCANRGMALQVVERAVAESGVTVELQVVDVKSEAHAKKRRFLGSPSVLVEGVDVEPGAVGRTDFTLRDRIYRCGHGGLQGWPDQRWIRSALLVATVQSGSSGNGSSETSSATSP